MLNELYTLDRSLQHFNVNVEQSHPWVKRLGRKDLLIAGVDATGRVTRIEHLGKQEAVTLFKIQESNQSNFPQVNWSVPALAFNTELAQFRDWQACPIGDLKRRLSLFREACALAEPRAGQARMLKRVREFCHRLRPRFPLDPESQFAAFPVLIERFFTEEVSADVWVRSLSTAVLAGAEEGLVPLPLVEKFLAGEPGKEDEVAILFDLADCTKFRCRVASPQMGNYLSRRLNATERAGGTRGLCALKGVEMPLETLKMPSPPLPVVGNTYLMSMNKDTPCQMRYGRIGPEIFPVGKETVRDLDRALKHLTTPDREGKNWKRVPGATKKKFNLLLIFLESFPMLEAAIAELFAGGYESDLRYEALCEEVCKALRGKTANDSELLHLFVLNKIDLGRVQVELSETFTAAQVIQGGAEWQEGARNRPLLPLPLKADGFVPSPAEAMRCLQMSWERGGDSHSDAPGCRLADVYEVLIAGRPGARTSAALLLRLTLQRTKDLLMAIGHAAHRSGKDAWKGIPREGTSNAVVAASLLGITLRKLGHRKEIYMEEPAFLIGRFLSLTDTLHAEYCKGVRSGDTPPQLLGNALVPTAIADPNKGFARMLLRVRVYQAWARGRKGTGLARWSCAEMGKIANELAGKLADLRLTEAQQAQLLLGYLARTEKAGDEGAQESC